jgi:hypothetical protein
MARSSNKLVRATRDRQRIAGFQAHYAASAQVLIGNVQYTQAAAIEVYQSDLDADALVASTLAAYRKAVADAELAHQKTDAFDLQVKTFVAGVYGQPPGPAADFGIAAKVTHTVDATTMAEAVAKRAATRAARHTLGPRQKAKITGTTPATPSTPAVNPGVTSNGAAAPIKS